MEKPNDVFITIKKSEVDDLIAENKNLKYDIEQCMDRNSALLVENEQLRKK